MIDADVAIVEGVMGLFDGRDGTTEAGSTAQIAKWLGAPVLLTLDCSAVARSAAALVKGYQQFDPGLVLGGLLFNKVGGAAHTKWLTDAVNSAGLGIPVLGGVPKDATVAIQERYLGLHLPFDPVMPQNLIQNLSALASLHIDLDAVMDIARTVPCINGAGAGAETKTAVVKSDKSADVHSDMTEQKVHNTLSASNKKNNKKKRKNSKKKASHELHPTATMRSDTANTTEIQLYDGGDDESSVAHITDASHVDDHDDDNVDDDADITRTELDAVHNAAAAVDDVIPSTTAASEDQHAISKEEVKERCVCIAVAHDAAFCFYYHDNLALLREAGAEIVYFSPLTDSIPENIHGIYLGGGYPESHAAELADNKLFRAGIKAFAQAGGVIYAECGGLLVLSQSIQHHGEPAQPMGVSSLQYKYNSCYI